jgi:hypothetical protein
VKEESRNIESPGKGVNGAWLLCQASFKMSPSLPRLKCPLF